MKKLKLTPEAEHSLLLLNKLYFDEESILYDCYDKASEFEVDLFDDGMFVDEIYTNNTFDTLEEMALNISETEGDMNSVEGVLNWLNNMIKNNILIIENEL